MNDFINAGQDKFCYQTTMSLVRHLNSENYGEALPILVFTPQLVDANFEIDDAWKPLDVCISQGIRTGTEILVLLGADLNLKNRMGLLPAEFAMKNNFTVDEHTYKVLSGKIKPRSLAEITQDIDFVALAPRSKNSSFAIS